MEFMHTPARGIITRRFYHNRHIPTPSRWQQARPYAPAYALIGICCSGYAYNLYADDQVAKKRNYTHRAFIDKHLIFSRENYNAGRWWTVITHSVMHVHALHLFCNMVGLASFGPISVVLYGLPSTAFMWIGSSVASSWAILAAQGYKARQIKSDRRLPHGQPPASGSHTEVLGSSSSVLGLITAITCARPRDTVYIMPVPVPLRLGIVAVGFAVFSATAWFRDLLPGIGHTGHLGGMAFGALYYVLVLRRRMRFPRF